MLQGPGETIGRAVSAHLTHILHQAAVGLQETQLTGVLDWVRASAVRTPVFLRLPLMTCEATGGDPAEAIPVATAWHLLHSAARLLDDVADNGSPAISLQTAEGALHTAATSTSEPGRSANAAAALIFLAQLSLTDLAQNGLEPERIVELVALFNTATTRMAFGQATDLSWDATSRGLDDYWRMVGAKTGEFFSLACRAGALLGKPSQADVNPYGVFGYHLGVLIQIGDDLRAIWQPARLDDLATAARTLPVVYGISVAPGRAQRVLGMICDLQNDPSALSRLQSELADLGALHYAALQAGHHHRLAREGLLRSTRPSVAHQSLLELLDAAFPAVATDRLANNERILHNHGIPV